MKLQLRPLVSKQWLRKSRRWWRSIAKRNRSIWDIRDLRSPKYCKRWFFCSAWRMAARPDGRNRAPLWIFFSLNSPRSNLPLPRSLLQRPQAVESSYRRMKPGTGPRHLTPETRDQTPEFSARLVRAVMHHAIHAQYV